MEDHDGEEYVPTVKHSVSFLLPAQLPWLPFQKKKLLILTMRSWVGGGLAAALHSECTRALWLMDDKYFSKKKKKFCNYMETSGYSEHWIMFAHIGAWWLLCRNLSDLVFSSIFNLRSRKKGELFAFFYTIMDSNQMLSSCSKLKSWMNCEQTWDFEESETLEEVMAYT